MTVVDTQALHHGKASLSLLMNDKGGINDDCIITKVSDTHYYVVLNAGCKDADMNHMKQYMDDFKDCTMEYHSEDERSLIAI
jgi:aminomethyltransferase